jgi:hypothetical protein
MLRRFSFAFISLAIGLIGFPAAVQAGLSVAEREIVEQDAVIGSPLLSADGSASVAVVQNGALYHYDFDSGAPVKKLIASDHSQSGQYPLAPVRISDDGESVVFIERDASAPYIKIYYWSTNLALFSPESPFEFIGYTEASYGIGADDTGKNIIYYQYGGAFPDGLNPIGWQLVKLDDGPRGQFSSNSVSLTAPADFTLRFFAGGQVIHYSAGQLYLSTVSDSGTLGGTTPVGAVGDIPLDFTYDGPQGLVRMLLLRLGGPGSVNLCIWSGGSSESDPVLNCNLSLPGFFFYGERPTLSPDGRYLGVTVNDYGGTLPGLPCDDDNELDDVVIVDLIDNTAVLVSRPESGAALGNGNAGYIRIGYGGSRLVFTSSASNLVSNNSEPFDGPRLYAANGSIVEGDPACQINTNFRVIRVSGSGLLQLTDANEATFRVNVKSIRVLPWLVLYLGNLRVTVPARQLTIDGIVAGRYVVRAAGEKVAFGRATFVIRNGSSPLRSVRGGWLANEASGEFSIYVPGLPTIEGAVVNNGTLRVVTARV